MQIRWLLCQYLFTSSLQDKETSLLTGWMCWISGKYLEIFLFFFSQIFSMCLQRHMQLSPPRKSHKKSKVPGCSHDQGWLQQSPQLPLLITSDSILESLWEAARNVYMGGTNMGPCHRAASKDTEGVSCHRSLSFVSALHWGNRTTDRRLEMC